MLKNFVVLSLKNCVVRVSRHFASRSPTSGVPGVQRNASSQVVVILTNTENGNRGGLNVVVIRPPSPSGAGGAAGSEENCKKAASALSPWEEETSCECPACELERWVEAKSEPEVDPAEKET